MFLKNGYLKRLFYNGIDELKELKFKRVGF